MTEEEGLEGAVADDADAEYVRGVCERDIVGPAAALARYVPLLRALLTAPSAPSLQAAAALAYTRYCFLFHCSLIFISDTRRPLLSIALPHYDINFEDT